jgi:Tol biopolymer transport system component
VRRAIALAAVLLLTGGSTATSGSGDLIVFSSNRSQWRADHVFLYTPGGRLLALAAGTAPAWSPDRTRIAFVRGAPGRERELVVTSPDGRNEHTVIRQPVGAPPIWTFQGLAWSPDGTRIAFVELGPTIAIADVGTGAVVRIEQAHSPSWSPDGRGLVYEDAASAQRALLVANADGSRGAS